MEDILLVKLCLLWKMNGKEKRQTNLLHDEFHIYTNIDYVYGVNETFVKHLQRALVDQVDRTGEISVDTCLFNLVLDEVRQRRSEATLHVAAERRVRRPISISLRPSPNIAYNIISNREPIFFAFHRD